MAVAVAAVRPLHAQEPAPWQPSQTFGHLAYLGFNTLAGALSAGIHTALRGESLAGAAEAAAVGALGGAIGYGGKRVAVADFAGSGLVGRQVAAIGTSIVRNGGEGLAPLERVALPLGPVHLDVRTDARRVAGVHLNIAETIALGWAISRDELHFNARETLSSGAPVFDAPAHQLMLRGKNVNGMMASGVIVNGGIRNGSYRQTLTHERVHVLQHDLTAHAWADPLEAWLLGKLPHGNRWPGFLDPGLVDMLFSRPTRSAMESEARFLGRP